MSNLKYDKNGIPILSRSDLEMRVERNFLAHFAPDCLETAKATPIATIANKLQGDYELKVIHSIDLGFRNGKKVRGCYNLEARTISIDSSLEPGSPPFNFTLAHEVGHFVLHRQLTPPMLEQIDSGVLEDDDRDLVLDHLQSDNPRSWLEWQANKFASSLLFPRKTVPDFVISKQKELGITKNLGVLYLDRQSRNVSDFYSVLKDLEFTYQVSQSAIRIRLRELNILEDSSNRGDFGKPGPVAIQSPLVKVLSDMGDKLNNG